MVTLMDVVVNAKFKDTLYYNWVMWMMNGPRKTQPKSGNCVAADFVTVLSWVANPWKSVEKKTILSGVEKCYMSANPGPEFEVEAKPEEMKVEKAKKERKKIVTVKSKSPAELARLAKKKERTRKKLERAKQPKKPKKKATPKRKNLRKSPKRRVKRRKVQRKQKKK